MIDFLFEALPVMGTVAGMVVKVLVGVSMIVWFVVDVLWIQGGFGCDKDHKKAGEVTLSSSLF